MSRLSSGRTLASVLTVPRRTVGRVPTAEAAWIWPSSMSTLRRIAEPLSSLVTRGVTRKVMPAVIGVTSAVRLFNPVTEQFFRKNGAGGSLNGNVEVYKNLRLFSNNFWGNGEGRYLFGIAPDFVVRPNGSPSMIHSGSTASGVEFQRKNSLLYAYYGGVYIGRNAIVDADGITNIGYGFTGSPNSQNRSTQEITSGLTQTIWRDGKIGALQAMVQYAYLTRNPWFVAPGAPKAAHENVVYFNLRFTLAGAPPATR